MTMEPFSDDGVDDPAWSAPAAIVARGMLDDLITDQLESHRHAARRADGICEALAHARRHPEVYTDLPGALGSRAAESAVLLEISIRLQLPEGTIRNLAWAAQHAGLSLPRLWERAREGFVPFGLIEAAVTEIMRLAPGDDVDEATRSAAQAAVDLVDQQAAQWVLTLTAGAVRRRLRALVNRLDPRPAADRHALAALNRRVVLEDADDGMAWLSVLLPRIDALSAKRRLTSVAKHTLRSTNDGRTRDQARADLAADWLCGRGMPSGAKTKIFVTIPVSVLDGTAPGGYCGVCGGSGLAPQAQIVGDEQLDDATAVSLFLKAKAFHRVVVDPIRSVVVDLERHSRRATRAQRDWLSLQHGTCARDGCTRSALDADIDHVVQWAHGGRTNLNGLRPLCPVDHHRRHDTRTVFTTRSDGSVGVTTPTGWSSRKPPPG